MAAKNSSSLLEVEEIPLDWFNPVYEPYIESTTRYEVYYGGRGSGKSEFIAQKLILRCCLPEYFKCVYSRKHHDHIRDSQFSALKKWIKEFGLDDEFRILESRMTIIHIGTGNMFIAKGVDDPEKVKSIDEPSQLWCEELPEFDEEDFLTLDKSIRTNKSSCQTIVSFNPVMATSWVRDHFFDPEDPHKAHAKFGADLSVLRTTYQDNTFIDREAYYKTLLLGASGDTNRIRVDITGDWGMPDNKNPWLYNFKKDVHVQPVTFLPSYPVYLSFDFNRDPITCSAWQMSPGFVGPAPFIHCIQEFSGQIQLQDLCQRIKTAFPASILYVTGDSSGNKGDIGYDTRHASAYKMIQAYLHLSEKQMNQNLSNLEHENSRLLCNAMFYHFNGLRISPNCTILISDCEIAAVDEEAKKPNMLKKDRGIYKMDMFDTARYFFQRYCYEYVKKRFLNLK